MTIDPPAGPVLLCHDGSDDAARAIGTAAALLGARAATVLTVWEPARELTPLDPVGDAVGRFSGLYAEWDRIGLGVAREIADAGVRLALDAGFTATARVESGTPATTIVAVGRELCATAIVLGSRGRSGVSGMLGSVSARVCRLAHRPVLVLPPRR